MTDGSLTKGSNMEKNLHVITISTYIMGILMTTAMKPHESALHIIGPLCTEQGPGPRLNFTMVCPGMGDSHY